MNKLIAVCFIVAVGVIIVSANGKSEEAKGVIDENIATIKRM